MVNSCLDSLNANVTGHLCSVITTDPITIYGKTLTRFVRARDAIITMRQASADSFSRENDG